MRQIDLRTFDLNLLVVFETIMRERHVGRSGEALGLTQPAVSHALARLRDLVGDPLFVKRTGGVEPTLRAEALARPVGEALAQLRAALNDPAPFDPADLRRTVTIGAADYIDLTLMPPLMREVRRLAPGLDLRRRPATRHGALGELRRREVDMVIGPLGATPAGLTTRPLFEERWVLVARPGHPALAKPLTLQTLAGLDHLLVSPGGGPTGGVDEMLRARGFDRRVALTVPQFLAAPFIVAATDLVVVLAERVARRLAEAAGVAIHPEPVPAPGWTVGLGRRSDAPPDPALDWLTEVAQRAAQEIDP